MYTAWNIWMERNRRIFDEVSAPQTRILGLIKEEMKLCDLACGGGDLGV
jgi:2-polyprenyl-3-methyl-5-hydroxy-6-metoxy-1,4-benzoquinol methylase